MRWRYDSHNQDKEIGCTFVGYESHRLLLNASSTGQSDCDRRGDLPWIIKVYCLTDVEVAALNRSNCIAEKASSLYSRTAQLVRRQLDMTQSWDLYQQRQPESMDAKLQSAARSRNMDTPYDG